MDDLWESRNYAMRWYPELEDAHEGTPFEPCQDLDLHPLDQSISLLDSNSIALG